MRRFAALGIVSLTLALCGRSAGAAASGAAGYDYYRGMEHRETHTVLGVAGVPVGAGDVLGGGLWFDDDVVGSGYGLVLGGGIALGGPAALRVLTTRFVGDEGYRAWRVKVGPQWTLAGGGTLGLSWVRDVNNLGPDTDGGAGELSVPLASRWTGRLSGSIGRSGDVTGYAASAGAGWTVAPHLELAGELGLARNPPATTPAPSGGRLLPPILDPGEPPPAQADDEVATTTLLSLRVTF